MKKVLLPTVPLVLFVLLGFGTIRAVYAHGQPIIAVNPPVVASGGQIIVTGSEMEAGEVFTITLEGMNGTTKLGEAAAVKPADQEDGGFEVTLTIPQDTSPGSYTVKASTDEGEAAMADLTVNSSSTQGSDAITTMQEASSAPHILDRTKPRGVEIGVGLAAFASLFVGIVLIRWRD